jgi:hypothetical protein
MTTPTTYPTIDWKKNEYWYLQEALTILKQVIEREDKRHEMDQDLTPSMYSLLVDEIIPMFENELEIEAEYDPTDDISGEPPITAAEMHTAAWKQHQEMHS